MTTFEKKSANLQVSLDLDDQLTWGELFRFVDLARNAGASPDDPVGTDSDYEENGCTHPTRLLVYMHPDLIDSPRESASLQSV